MLFLLLIHSITPAHSHSNSYTQSNSFPTSCLDIYSYLLPQVVDRCLSHAEAQVVGALGAGSGGGSVAKGGASSSGHSTAVSSANGAGAGSASGSTSSSGSSQSLRLSAVNIYHLINLALTPTQHPHPGTQTKTMAAPAEANLEWARAHSTPQHLASIELLLRNEQSFLDDDALLQFLPCMWQAHRQALPWASEAGLVVTLRKWLFILQQLLSGEATEQLGRSCREGGPNLKRVMDAVGGPFHAAVRLMRLVCSLLDSACMSDMQPATSAGHTSCCGHECVTDSSVEAPKPGDTVSLPLGSVSTAGSSTPGQYNCTAHVDAKLLHHLVQLLPPCCSLLTQLLQYSHMAAQSDSSDSDTDDGLQSSTEQYREHVPWATAVLHSFVQAVACQLPGLLCSTSGCSTASRDVLQALVTQCDLWGTLAGAVMKVQEQLDDWYAADWREDGYRGEWMEVGAIAQALSSHAPDTADVPDTADAPYLTPVTPVSDLL